jgi:hypothetical protein
VRDLRELDAVGGEIVHVGQCGLPTVGEHARAFATDVPAVTPSAVSAGVRTVQKPAKFVDDDDLARFAATLVRVTLEECLADAVKEAATRVSVGGPGPAARFVPEDFHVGRGSCWTLACRIVSATT